MKKLLLTLGVLAAVGVFALTGCDGKKEEPKETPKEQAAPAAPATAGAYWCSMHHDQTSNDPNAMCPKCGMPMVPRSAESGEMPMQPPTETPPVEEPAAPVVEEPATPVVEEPAAPAVEEPAAPVVEEPAAPAVEEPAAEEPAVQVPTVEEPAAPADPDAGKSE